MTSLTCHLKGRQQVIYLKENRAASCCRAHSIMMESGFSSLHQHWHHESRRLDHGERLPGCEHCWREEDQGRVSYRQIINDRYKLRIEINADNLCNHMCSYCSPRFSSMWEDSITKSGPFQNIPASDLRNMVPISRADIDTFKTLTQIREYIQNVGEPVTVALLGGEPLMQIDALEKLTDFDLGDNVTLEIITNLNPPSMRFLERILERYQNRSQHLKFLISLDATPEYNHVIRHGFDAGRFYRCLDLVNQYGCERSISATVSALSVLDLPYYLSWLEQNSLSAIFNILNNPRSLSVANVPRSMRLEISNSIIDSNTNPILVEQLDLPQASSLDQFACHQYLTQYFSRTGTDPLAVDHARFREFWAGISG